MMKSLLKLSDLTPLELEEIVKMSEDIKRRLKAERHLDILRGKVIGLLFEKPSTRTRVGFESASVRLGGDVLYLSPSELQIKRGEPLKDTARILGRYLDVLVMRVNSHSTLEEFKAWAGIPIINALSDLTHPTQAISDLLTILETKGRFKDLKLAYIGDGNNVCHSLIFASALTGMHIHVACPKKYYPNTKILEEAHAIAKTSGASIEVTTSPQDALRDADVLYTDTWVSMGEEAKKEEKVQEFKGYQLNDELLKYAKKDAIVMHCLPAYRGYEITDELIEGERSVVWQQGENKMYGAAAVLAFVLAK